MEIFKKAKEELKHAGWEALLIIIEQELGIIDEEKKKEFEEFMNNIKDSFEYYDEEKIDLLINKLLERIGIEENEKERFKKIIKKRLMNYFRKSPEKKGINFRDKVEDLQEIRAWLYLVLPEEEKEQFKNDFQQAITAKEPIFFRLWLPSISNAFRHFIDKKKPVAYKSSEFLKDVEGYIEDIQQGKNRITLYFDEDKLPENFKNKSKEELEKLGIHKVNGEYEIYITPEKISEMLNLLIKDSLSLELSENRIAKKILEARNLLEECKFIQESYEGKNLYNSLVNFLSMLTLGFRNLMESGASEEELKKFEENVDSFKGQLEELKKNKEEKDKTKIIKTIGEVAGWLKEKGSNILTFILSSIGLWALALGWFLPLWLIDKLQKEIEKK